MQKLMSLTVALVMLLVLLLPVSATEYATITCGEAFTMEGVDGKTYYQFVAETDGWYCIWTEGA